MATIKGMYTHPNQLIIGNSGSENNYLAWAIRQGVNMLNCYARSFFYSDAARTKLAAFVAKAKSYGILEVSVDVRLTDNRELPGITAYLQKYIGTKSMIFLLAEYEPYVLKKKDDGSVDCKYDDLTLCTYEDKYAHFFDMLGKLDTLTAKYGTFLDWYEGWVGNNYSKPQDAVDAMVKHCKRIFISNYVSQSDYNSTSSSLGAWDNRMDKRCAAIATAAKNVSKANVDIVEIVSLEPDFLYNEYKSHSFYGSLYTRAQAAYNASAATTLQYTNLIGRTMFYSKYAQQLRP